MLVNTCDDKINEIIVWLFVKSTDRSKIVDRYIEFRVFQWGFAFVLVVCLCSQ